MLPYVNVATAGLLRQSITTGSATFSTLTHLHNNECLSPAAVTKTNCVTRAGEAA